MAKRFTREEIKQRFQASIDAGQPIVVAADQNFVPVIDDKNAFIGIVTRSTILKYCLDRYFAPERELAMVR